MFTLDFALACVTPTLFFLVGHLLLPVLPLYVLQVGGHERDIGWVVASFSVATFLIRPWSGKWSEKVGPARVMRVVSTLAFVIVLMYNFANAVLLLVVTRIIHGLIHGVYVTSSASLVAYMAPVARRGQAMGVFLLFAVLALAVGPAIGVWVVSAVGFSALFVAIGITFLLALTLTQLIDRRNQYVPSRQSEGRLINVRAFLPAFLGLTTYYTYGALLSYITPYAIKKGLDNPGLFFTAFAVCAVLVRMFGGGISDRVGRVAVIVPSALAMSLSMFGLGLAPNAWSIIVVGVVYGLGSGILLPVLIALSIDLVEATERSSAVSTYYASQDLGQALGGIVSALLVGFLPLEAVWIVAGALALCGLGVFIVFGHRPRVEPMAC